MIFVLPISQFVLTQWRSFFFTIWLVRLCLFTLLVLQVIFHSFEVTSNPRFTSVRISSRFSTFFYFSSSSEVKGYFSLRTQIITSAVLAMSIYVRQLFVGMKSYKKHKMQIFQGIYHDIPSAANFNANSITSKSVHYSGFLVGYMAWGFIISFHLILVLLSTINILSLQMQYLEWVLAFTVPVMLIYLINILGNSTFTKFFFIRDYDEKLNIENRKFYAIFVYFNFFAGLY